VAAKSKSGKFTLVHYLVQQLKANDEDCLQLPNDLHAVEDASKYTVGQLQGDFAVIRKGMKTVATEVEWANKAEDAESFVELMQPFATAAQQTVADSEEKLQSLKKNFEELVTAFGENAAKTGRCCCWLLVVGPFVLLHLSCCRCSAAGILLQVFSCSCSFGFVFLQCFLVFFWQQ
jgi:hypothetical protein